MDEKDKDKRRKYGTDVLKAVPRKWIKSRQLVVERVTLQFCFVGREIEREKTRTKMFGPERCLPVVESTRRTLGSYSLIYYKKLNLAKHTGTGCKGRDRQSKLVRQQTGQKDKGRERELMVAGDGPVLGGWCGKIGWARWLQLESRRGDKSRSKRANGQIGWNSVDGSSTLLL